MNVAVSLLFVALASNLLVMLGYAPILPVASTAVFAITAKLELSPRRCELFRAVSAEPEQS